MTACFKRITAVLAAGMLLCAACPTAYALDPVPTQPDWVPSDYESIVRFLNTYGTTHIADGFICIVTKELEDCAYTYNFTKGYSKSVTSDVVYEYAIDGTIEDPYAPYISYDLDLPKYRVIALMPETVGTLELSISRSDPSADTGEPVPVAYYTFEHTESGVITETDDLSWRPDCVTEFDAYLRERGVFSRQGNLLVVAEKFNPSTGADCILGQDGAKWELANEYYISEVRMSIAAVGGESLRKLLCYAPAEEGLAQFTLFAGRKWDPQYPDAEELTAVEATKNDDGTYDFTFTSRVFCDLNSDHSLDLADLVLLSRFLIADLEFTDAQMMIADYNGDHKVNAADLSAIKALIMTDYVWIHDPIIIDDPIMVVDK